MTQFDAHVHAYDAMLSHPTYEEQCEAFFFYGDQAQEDRDYEMNARYDYLAELAEEHRDYGGENDDEYFEGREDNEVLADVFADHEDLKDDYFAKQMVDPTRY